jgi:parvulin-like peptidyl-prolyl isomerase
LLREPLVHFLVLGALIFAAAQLFGEDRQYVIDAGAGQRARLASIYQQQYGTPPTAHQLDALLDQYVRSEILYREGLALGLDRDDEIVRRRIVQKLEFVNQDAATPAGASDEEARKFFDAHRNRYQVAPTASFEQLYFSPDVSDDAAARKRAEQALATVQRDARPSGDDPFPEGASFQDLERDGLDRIFGASPFSEAAFAEAPVGSWAGPYRSGFGWHLVKVVKRKSATPAEFKDVRARVVADLNLEAQQRGNEEEFRKLAAKYHVVTDRSPT